MLSVVQLPAAMPPTSVQWALFTAKATKLILEENGRDQGHVGQMIAAAAIGIVVHEDIARDDSVGREFLQNGFDGKGQRAQKAGHAVGLGDDVAGVIGDGTGVVQHLVDDGALAAAAQGDKTLLSRGDQLLPDDFDGEGICAHGNSNARIMRFHAKEFARCAETIFIAVALHWSGKTTVVEVGSSMTRGPAMAYAAASGLVHRWGCPDSQIRQSGRVAPLCTPVPGSHLPATFCICSLLDHAKGRQVVVDQFDRRCQAEGVGLLVQLVELLVDGAQVDCVSSRQPGWAP